MRRRTLHLLAVSCVFTLKAVHYVHAFAGLESVVVQSSALPPLLQHAATNSWHAVQDTVMAFLPSPPTTPPPPPSLVQSVVTTAAATATAASHNMAVGYAHALEQNALATQMVTGGVLALTGDAIAQYTQQQQQQQQAKQQQQQQIVVPQAGNDLSATAVATTSTSTTTTTLSFQYDTLRATSFVLFDIAYRALQHVAFPAIVQHCHGQYLSALFSFLPCGSSSSSSSSMVYDFLSTQDLAAMEQTLANQGLIIPFLYYPVFFALTGYIQNLTLVESWQRALETFPVVMPRNLLFWIPVQYYQFRYLPADLHIPFVCVAGLCWTVILSLAAGSTTKTATATADEQQGQTVVMDNMLVEQLSAYDEDEQRQQLVDMKGRATVRP